MMALIIVISTAWTVTCLVAARQVKRAMARKRARGSLCGGVGMG
jgi:hypothetical protein